MKPKFVYDAEVFPNYSLFAFKNIDTKEKHRFTVFSNRQSTFESIKQLESLYNFLDKQAGWLIGFNSIAYDNLLLAYLIKHRARLLPSTPNRIVQELYDLSKSLASFSFSGGRAPEYYILRYIKLPFRSLDLMMLYNTIERTGLKNIAIGLKCPFIEDLPFPPDHIVLAEEIAHIEKYNDNDLEITHKLLQHQSKNINLRIEYTKKYGTDIVNSCDSDIGRQVIADYYQRESSISYKTFSQKRTGYIKLALKDCVSDKIYFETPEYTRVYQKILETIIDPNLREDKAKKKKQFELTLRSKYLTHTIGLGGLHSDGPSEILTETDRYAYIDIDVEGFYGSIISNDGLYPNHLGPAFTKIYKEYIVEERRRIKHANPVLSAILKKAANATFGLTKADYDGNWLYDPRMTTFICVSGQLYLLMLMEAIEKYSHGIVVYSNTDGLTVRIPREEVNLLYSICRRWESLLNFKLEYVWCKRLIVRDVNNFIMFSYSDDPEKHIKAKGGYRYKKKEFEGYKYPIIAKAIQDYFELDAPIEDTILQEQSIYEFMSSEKTSLKKFRVVLYPVRDRLSPIQLQKNNRWIVTHGNPNEGKLYKISLQTDERQEMQKDFYVTPINNVDEKVQIEDYKLNYDFYINQALSMINMTQELNKETHVKPEITQTVLFQL